MAITTYNGPPGAGKSHALVKDVILRAVLAGRRVVSNIDGLNPDAIRAYCLERPNLWVVERADDLGEVVLFDGQQSREPGFWPTEATEAAGAVTFVRPGDLVAFDEWAMYYPTGVKDEPTKQVELFMRWHRHLTGPDGVACDLAIATQAITDFHRSHRALLSKSYLFKKLDAVGAEKSYTWHVYDGRFQKGSGYRTGTGKYDPAIFPLYASSAAAGAGNHTELRTNRKATIWGGWKAWAVIAAAPLLFIGGAWGLYSIYPGEAGAMVVEDAENASARPTAPSSGIPAPAPQPVTSPWRIVGVVEGEFGTRIIVADEKGGVRMLLPRDFQFDEGRPVSGFVDGQRAVAVDQLPTTSSGSPFGGIVQ